jgi:hypothetical protein
VVAGISPARAASKVVAVFIAGPFGAAVFFGAAGRCWFPRRHPATDPALGECRVGRPGPRSGSSGADRRRTGIACGFQRCRSGEGGSLAATAVPAQVDSLQGKRVQYLRSRDALPPPLRCLSRGISSREARAPSLRASVARSPLPAGKRRSSNPQALVFRGDMVCLILLPPSNIQSPSPGVSS